jgi:hypothetical protein
MEHDSDSEWTSNTLKGRRLKVMTFVLVGLAISIILFLIVYFAVGSSWWVSLLASCPALLLGIGLAINASREPVMLND